MEATVTTYDTTQTGFSREAVEELSRRKGEPDWLRDARLAAWETYERLPMPQRTDEEWRRTDLRPLKLDRLVPFAAPNGNKVATLGKGDLIGEMGLLERKPRNADVIAASPMRVIKLTHWEIRRMSDETIERIKEIVQKRQQQGVGDPAYSSDSGA